jgi:hypothetical protein
VATQQTGAATVDLPAGRLRAYLAAAAPAGRAARMRVLGAVGVQ